MLKSKSICLLSIILCFISDITISFSQAPEIEWQRTIGGDNNDGLRDLNVCMDKGFIMAGSSLSNLSGTKNEELIGGTLWGDYWVVKMDSAGNVEWQNTIGGTGEDQAKKIIQTSDGGYIIAGSSTSNISADKNEVCQGSYDYWIVKLNELGNIVWQNTIGGSGDDEAFDIKQTTDGGYIVGGYSSSGISGDKTQINKGDKDYWIVKLSPVGSIDWQQCIGGSAMDWLNVIIPIDDVGYLLCGYSTSGISGDKSEANIGSNDFWIVKINPEGLIIWQNTIGGNASDELNSAVQTTDGFVLAGTSQSGATGDKTEGFLGGTGDYWVVKINSTGEIIWQNTLGGNALDNLKNISFITDEGFILSGYSASDISADKSEDNFGITFDYWVVCLDISGNLNWENTYGGDGTDYLFKLIPTPNNSFILGGISSSGISGDKSSNCYTNLGIPTLDFWIVKLAVEKCNGVDDDGDGLIDDNDVDVANQKIYYQDLDDDDFGNISATKFACILPAGYSSDNQDCDDLDNTIYPNAMETENSIDDDCNGIIDDLKPGFDWQISIGGSGRDFISKIIETSDGGYLIGAVSNSGISGDKTEAAYPFEYSNVYDYWIIKLTSTGGIEWQNTIGAYSDDLIGEGDDRLNDIKQTSDGGYIICGSSSSDLNGDKTEECIGSDDYWIVKVDASGNIEWDNTIGGSDTDIPYSITQTNDGGYLVGGASESGISGDKTESNFGTSDYWILKLSPLGEIQWQNTIGGNNMDELMKIINLDDGGYLLGGWSNSAVSGDKTESGVGGPDYWILKIDSIGNILWQNTIIGNQADVLKAIGKTNDGGFILFGESDSNPGYDKTDYHYGFSDYWPVKTDSIGNVQWENTMGGILGEYAEEIFQCEDGGYLLTGSSYSGISGSKIEGSESGGETWIVKLKSNGFLDWQNSFITNGDNIGVTSVQTADQGFLIGTSSDGGIGYDKTSISHGDYDIWLVKLTAECSALPELCNSLDDNCNGIIDEDVIESCSISAVGSPIICPGESVTLNAVYSGTSVQWKKNGYPIPGATTSSYTTSSKGFYLCASYSDCDTVISNTIFVNSLKGPPASITAGGPTTFCSGGSVVLTANTGIGLSYQWYKGGTALVGATSINYTATIAGNYKCKVTKFFTGCIKYSNVISVSVPCKEGESNSSTNNELSLFPNPANDKLNIQIESQLLSPFSFLLTITDLEGREIYTTHLNSLTTEINISDFASGMYFVKMKINDEEMIEKFIKN